MGNNNDNYLWITWEIQRRNRSLSSALSARLIEITVDSNRIIRYLLSIYKTIKAIRTYKPDIYFVQNPSIVLATTALIYHKITGIPFVVDAHNAGVYPSSNKHNPLNLLAKFILKRTPVTIVTNEALCRYVESVGGNAAQLPDPLPQLQDSHTPAAIKAGCFNVLFICTWAEDEPYLEVVEAARKLPEDVCIYITGKSRNKLEGIADFPKNVVLTGFISVEEFDAMLHQCDLILDLTTRENCLVCGAYEALSAEQPQLLSDTRALREYFGESALYTNNSAEDIAEKIKQARANIESMKERAASGKKLIDTRYQQMLTEFKQQLVTQFYGDKSLQ